MTQYFTTEGLKKLRDELEQLKTVEMRKVIELIKYAASFGDLKENAGYHEAKERQSLLERRISELEDIVNTAVVRDKVESDKIQIGSTITISMDGEQECMNIVASGESDILKNKISYLSPLGEKLVGRKQGDAFDFKINGKIVKIKILSVV